MSEELKSCPFCGSGAECRQQDWDYMPDTWQVICMDTDCFAETCEEESEEKAIKAWNTRTKPEYKYTTAEEWWDSTRLDIGGGIGRGGFNAARELKEIKP